MSATVRNIKDKERRKSIVFKLFELPRGARKRQLGYRHDQIWYYADPGRHDALAMANQFMAQYWRGDPILWKGKQWKFMHSEHRWMRLYMDRKLILTPWFTLRLHTFWSGDDSSAPHDHPFPFWTFPLSSYYETVEYEDARGAWRRTVRCVKLQTLHYRPADYRHFIHEPARHFRTIVISGRKLSKEEDDWEWGYWPTPDKKVPYHQWTSYE